MSIQKVREYFKGFGIEDRIREFDISSATVELAAIAVGVEGARIAKSMSFKIGEEPIIIVMAGDAKVDNSRYKAQFHTKAKMLTFDEAHTMIGHDPGGVCSFALPDNVKTYLDISLKRFETVFLFLTFLQTVSGKEVLSFWFCRLSEDLPIQYHNPDFL